MTVPVFNCTDHFKQGSDVATRSQAVDIVTQRAKTDASYNGEIPQGSFVAVHSTVSFYTQRTGQKSKAVSFNLLAVQILALPNDV